MHKNSYEFSAGAYLGAGCWSLRLSPNSLAGLRGPTKIYSRSLESDATVQADYALTTTKYVNSAFHPSGVRKMRTSFGCEGKVMVHTVCR